VPKLRRTVAAALALSSFPLAAQMPELTIRDVRTLPTPGLARWLLGERLAARVIEGVRHDDGSARRIPSSVDFYTQPEVPWPRINGICRTDVITVEYDWFDLTADTPDSAPIRIAHVEAASRFLAFPEPAGEPGTPDYDRASEAACAHFRSALDAFRAPSASDAQWLASLEAEWRQDGNASRFAFTCEDAADASCGSARRALAQLKLNRAIDVRNLDCPANRTRPRDQVNYCYRLSFNYAESDDPEWLLMVVGGMRDGMAPVEIRALHLQRVERSVPIP
jgi:hypothetical protein